MESKSTMSPVSKQFKPLWKKEPSNVRFMKEPYRSLYPDERHQLKSPYNYHHRIQTNQKSWQREIIQNIHDQSGRSGWQLKAG